MHFINNIHHTLKTSVVKFPSALILGFFAAICFSLDVWISNCPPIIEQFGLDACFALVLSVLMELLFAANPKSFSKPALLSYLPIIFCFFPIHQIFAPNSTLTELSYYGLIFAMLSLICYMLKNIHGSAKIIPVIITSSIIAIIASVIIGSGLSIITAAVLKLILNNCFSNALDVYATIWIFTAIFVLPQFLLAYITKTDFVIPKFHKVIFQYILLPLFAVLLLVLYVYIIQSAIRFNLPHINWFSSVATASFILIYFSLQSYSCKINVFFYKYGHFFIYPIVIIQLINFFQRISAYGFTAVRVASLYYIIFTVIFLLLITFHHQRFSYRIFLLLPLILIIATCTPLNTVSVAVKSQQNRIARVYKNHSLIEKNRLVTDIPQETFSPKEKQIISDAFQYFKLGRLYHDTRYKRFFYLENLKSASCDAKTGTYYLQNKIYKTQAELFQAIFGFPFSKKYATDQELINYNYIKISQDDAEAPVFNISNFTQMCEITGRYEQNQVFKIICDFGEIDITDFIMENLAHPDSSFTNLQSMPSPVTIATPQGTLIITSLDAANFDSYGQHHLNSKWRFYCNGYVFR